MVALASSATAAIPARAEEKAPSTLKLGRGATYEALGQLPMMHAGRIKPIDTVAREEIKQIYTRETIKLVDERGETVATWGPVAAFFDWSVRPKFWDEQPIISVEYLPLKRFILAHEVVHSLESILGKAATTEADRSKLKAMVDHPDEIEAKALRSLALGSKIAKEDADALLKLAAKLGEETKWLSPAELEEAEVIVDGKHIPFLSWLQDLGKRGEEAGSMGGGKPKLSDVEQKGFEVGMRLAHYRSIRDKEAIGMVPLLGMPRPANAAMLHFTAEAYKKASEQGPRSLNALELEAFASLNKYLNDIPSKDQAMPGTDPAFDARYTAWLKDKSAWVPLGVIRETAVEELAKAGFPSAKVEAFRAAFKAMEGEELAYPGRASEKPALALIDSARDLGASINAGGYPSPAEMSRESHFNEFAPFFKAPMAYLSGVVLLLLSLVARGYDAPTNRIAGFGRLSRAFYLAGIAGFASGIALEAYGFLLRVLITGWAPVSNMYETVIWVSMVLSIIGFVLEAIHRKTYAALAGSIVALLGTTLAATVPMLDPKIPQLPPVLRSNFWLSIHVLTIVSSYAAFALAWGLGLIATATYLTATYKRSSGLVELASPVVVGLPPMFLGWLALDGRFGSREMLGPYGFWLCLAVASIGGVITGAGFFALLGELVNRSFFRLPASLDDSALAGFPGATPASGYRGPASAGPDSGGLAVLTRAEPTATATMPSARPKLDARAEAMRATAAQIKPMASFIYRSMQVGILLVAAGTFLGGWWADVSWGRFWGWDPKEVWALITLLVYLMPLHGRFAGWVNTFWLVMSSVACFCSVLMAWYGVNFVLGVGLHSYGSGEGGQGPVLIATVVILGFAAGAFWRRHQSSKLPAIA